MLNKGNNYWIVNKGKTIHLKSWCFFRCFVAVSVGVESGNAGQRLMLYGGPWHGIEHLSDWAKTLHEWFSGGKKNVSENVLQ